MDVNFKPIFHSLTEKFLVWLNGRVAYILTVYETVRLPLLNIEKLQT